MRDLNVLISGGSQEGLGWLGIDDLSRLEVDSTAIFLGIDGDEAHFVVDISKNEEAVR